MTVELYIDTNIVYKLFDRLADLLKRNENMENIIWIAPTKIKYLYEVRERYKYFVSNLTKAEIFRYLHSSLGVSKDNCFHLWDFFKELLRVEEIFVEKIDVEKICFMLSEKFASKGIIINLVHLLVAEERRLTVITGDKPLKDRFSQYYRNVISYIEFRQLN